MIPLGADTFFVFADKNESVSEENHGVISFCGEKRIISFSSHHNDLVITSNGDRALEVCAATRSRCVSTRIII